MELKDRQGGQGSDRTSDSDDDDEVRMKNSKLFAAIHDGQLEKVISLLEQGAKTDITDKNNKNNTPLHYAVEKGKIEITKELLNPKWKTNTNLKNKKGKTPLHIAFMRNNHEILQLLLSHRAKVGDNNVENSQGRGVLVFNKAGNHIIAEEGKSVKGDTELLSKGAAGKPTTSNKQLKTEISNASSDTAEFVKTELRGVISVEDNEAGQLANALRHLPIPLKLSVAYIKVENQDLAKKGAKGKFTIKSYLQEFRKHAEKVLKKASSKKLYKCSEITTIAWKVTFDKINRQKGLGQLAVFLLNVMAHLATDDIPVDEIFLREGLIEKEKHDALKLLEQYSLIQLNGKNASIHSLVQKETRMEIKKQDRNEELSETTLRLLKICFDNCGLGLEDAFKQRRMLLHAEAFLSYTDEWLKNKPKKTREEMEQNVISDLLAIMTCNYDSNLDRKVHLLERAVAISKKKFGMKHKEVGLILSRLGYTYQYLGNAQKASNLQEQALEIVENSLGPKHFMVGLILSKLSSTYSHLGKVLEQKEMLERALHIMENEPGMDQFETMRLLSSLWNKDKSFEKELNLGRRLAARDYELVKIRVNLGDVYCAVGKPQKAKILQELALSQVENSFGPDHELVANVLTNLSNTYQVLGNTQKQKALLEKAAAIAEKRFRIDNSRFAKILANLGKAFYKLGDMVKAKKFQERALHLYECHFGPDQFLVGVALVNLGEIYGGLEDAKTQIELQERALVILEKYPGPNNFYLVLVLSCLGNAYRVLGDFQKNKDLQKRALAMAESYFKPEHIEVVRLLGLLCSPCGDLDDN